MLKKTLRIVTLILLICFSVTNAKALTSDYSVIDQAKTRLVVGDFSNPVANAGLEFKIAKGWKIYWRDPGDTGFEPRLNWQGSTNIKKVEFLWPAPYRQIDDFDGFSSESYAYKNHVIFPLKIIPEDASKPIDVNLQVDYGICEEICIPGKANISLNIQAKHIDKEQQNNIDDYVKLTPKPNGNYGLNIQSISFLKSDSQDYFIISASSETKFDVKKTDIFLEAERKAAFFQPKTTFSNDKKQLEFKAPISYLGISGFTNQDIILTLVSGSNSVEKKVNFSKIPLAQADTKNQLDEDNINTQQYSLWLILFFAFLGGLILNIMPCVLPVLSIKLMGVMNATGASKSQITLKFLVSAIGIIFSFVLIGVLLILLKNSGINAGWGFHFQQPLFVISLIVILLFFTANLWGFFEINLSSKVSDKALKASSGNGYVSSFFNGVFATILATPCTAPFLGTAVGFAITANTQTSLLIFLFMGLGMALPYLILCLFPQAIKSLPKPGMWMLKVKYFMGYLLVLTIFWLLYVISGQLGFFVALRLAVLCVLILSLLYMMLEQISVKGKIILYFVIFTLLALMFAAPKILVKKSSAPNISNDEIWTKFDKNKISELVKSGKKVFVDVTADWCLTCKVNKFRVLDTKVIESALSKGDVTAMRADWTNRNDNIADYLNKYNRAGIPFNIVYTPSKPNGIILSEILTKNAVLKALAD